jgi:hypothetical protein
LRLPLTKSARVIVGVLVILTASVSEAVATEGQPVDAFVASVIDAINSKSLERRRALLHPASLPCADTEPDSFYRFMVDEQSKDPIPAGSTWKVAPVPPDQPLPSSDKFDYPIRPTHTLQIDFDLTPRRSKRLILQLVHDGDRWFEMTACARAQTADGVRLRRQLAAPRAERVRALVAAMPPALRAELVELVKAGRRDDAVRRYQAATHEDPAWAVEVVELLSPR